MSAYRIWSGSKMQRKERGDQQAKAYSRTLSADGGPHDATMRFETDQRP